MDDLVLVYDKDTPEAGQFALDIYDHAKKWIGFSVQEPKPFERTSFTVNGANMGIIVTPNCFKSEFVTDALELMVAAKKPCTLIHYIASKCAVQDETMQIENDDYARYISKAKVCTYTFDLADSCQDGLINLLEFKSGDSKKELQRQAALRLEETRADILLFSSRVAKGRLNAAVHRRYDFCLTCAVEEPPVAEEVLNKVYDCMSRYAPALQVSRNQGDKAVTNLQQRTANIRDSFNLVVFVTRNCFATDENGKGSAVVDEVRAALDSELQVVIVQHLAQCPDVEAEIEKCQDSVLQSCLVRAMRYVYLEGTADATARSIVADPTAVKTDDNKTPRTRAAGVASFKLNYKNSQAMELAFDGRLAVYRTSLHEMKNKKISGDVETCIKNLFALYDTAGKGRITWAQFAEIDRLMTETLGGQYSEMISRRVYSMMLYPGLTLESEISYTTFFNYHAFIAKSMGIFDGEQRDVGIHYKYVSDKVKTMKKGKRFQKTYDLYVTHDRSKFSREFAFQLANSIRKYTPNIRLVLGTDFDKKEDDKGGDDKKKKEAAKVEEVKKNVAPLNALNMLVLLRPDVLMKDVVKEEIQTGLEGGAQVLMMCHVQKCPVFEMEVRKAPTELQAIMRRLPVFCYSPDNDASCVTSMLDQMHFPDWKPVANKAKTFRRNENPLVLHLFQRADEDEDVQNAFQTVANVTSPSSVNSGFFGYDFYKDGGLVILQDKLMNYSSIPAIAEAGLRAIANMAQCCGAHAGEVTERMCQLGMVEMIVQCVNQHTDFPLLQGEACRAIANIAAQSPVSKDKVNSLHGFQMILQSQKRNEEEPTFWDTRFEFRRLAVNDDLMVNYEGQGRWISGVVAESYSNGSYDVKFAHGGMGRRVPSHLVRPKDPSDKVLEFCGLWLWKPGGRLTEDSLLIKADGMVSLLESGQVGTWSVAEKDDGRAAIKLQLGTLMIEMERISVTTMRATASPHRAVLADELRACLNVQYFNYEDMTGALNNDTLTIPPLLGRKPDVTRLEQECNRAQGAGEPWTGLGPEFAGNFATRYSGTLSVAKMGDYTFDLAADASATLRVGARNIVPGKRYYLVAGTHTFRLDYCAKSAMEKKVQLRYQGPDTNETMTSVPAGVLQHDVAATQIIEKPGFMGEYFPVDMSEKMCMPNGTPDIMRVEKRLDFDMDTDPWTRLPDRYGSPGYCARYTGYLSVACGGKKRAMYKFFCESNKRARLYLNDNLLIDLEQTAAEVELTKGQHLIRVEFYSKPNEMHGLKVKYSGPETLPKQTKEEEEAEKAAFEEYEKQVKARQAFFDDPPEPEEGEEPPQPPPEPVRPAERIPEIVLLDPTAVSYYAPAAICVPKNDPLERHTGGISSVVFSQQDGIMCSGGLGGKVNIWSYVDGSHILTMDCGSPVRSLAFPDTLDSTQPSDGVTNSSLNLCTLAVGMENGSIALYNVSSAEAADAGPFKVMAGHTGPVLGLKFHPCRGEDQSKPRKEPRKASKASEAPPEEDEDGEERAESKEIVPCGGFGTKPNLFSCGQDGTLRMWNTMIGEETTEQPGDLQCMDGKKSCPQLSLSIACDGSALVSGGQSGRFFYFNADESDFVRGPDKVLPIPPEPEEGWPEDEGPPEPETEPGDPITFDAHSAPVTCVTWSPLNPRLMATASADATVIVWDMWNEEKTQLAPHHNMDPIQNLTGFVQWSPDCASIVCSNEDTNMQIFSAVSGNPRTAPLPGHIAAVVNGAWAPLGQCLATCSEDNSLRLWHFRLNRDIAEITTLEKEQAEFNHDMTYWQKLLDKIRKSFKDYTLWQTYEPDIYLLRSSLDKGVARTTSYNEREALLGLTRSDYYELDGMIDDYKPYYTLWDAVINFQKLQKLWHEKPLSTIDAPKVEEQLDQWFKDCVKMMKQFSSDSMKNVRNTARALRDAIEAFKVKFPFLRAFSSEAILQRHWDTLAERMDGKRPATSDIKMITMQEMLDIGVLDFPEDYEEISLAATKEFMLKRALAVMKQDWQPITLVLKPYKETGVPLLGGIDEIQAYLDDYIVKTQAIRSSPFCKPFEEEVHVWEALLLRLQDFVDETLLLQRSWMALEPIFISEDIKRQLPHESEQFEIVDKMFRERMLECLEDTNALRIGGIAGLIEDLKDGNETIEKVQKGLKDYLETKRLYFPRFFFLNDADLLSILAETKDPTAVQPHLGKAFEGVTKVRFDDGKTVIESMISAEGEEIELKQKIDTNKPGNRGAVERWLVELEESMMDTLRLVIAECNDNYAQIERHQWCLLWPGQVAICTSCFYWTIGAEDYLNKKKIGEYEKKLFQQISNIVELVRGDMSKLARVTVGALVTLDVHARDVITELREHGVDSPEDFEWLSQLRYYWKNVGELTLGSGEKNSKNECNVSIVNSTLLYGFEYLGNTARLVVTPLTDRCYRTLMGAFALYYGGAPEGPAGTGKTESTKDLAKALAVQCVVFNCSDSMDYLQLAKFFKGLASSGAWCCFDEFNRISLEVLSVVAQQIQQISLAIKQRVTTFVFEETEIRLVPTCAVNITMNPGYAGRSELPDNLKALFRPCAMMVPNYALIGEIRLYSYGYEDAKRIGMKATMALKLSSEQLSPAKHYDFGMRGLNALLVAGGNGKRTYGDKYPEDVIALRSFTDVNLPKFTSADIPLFKGIIGDLFPGVRLPPADYGNLVTQLEAVTTSFGLQPTREFTNKAVQLWETIVVRHGLMTVGFPPCGKTSIKDVLATTLEKIAGQNELFMPVVQYVMNPKSITQGQLYGEADLNTQEWTDGVLAIAVRNGSQPVGADGKMRRQWVVLDGPVDAIWIENMNTVLDDNKKLCLNSGEIIKLSPVTTMLFEVRDLEYASPATVSRVGIVYLEPDTDLGWTPIVQSWLLTLPDFIRKDHEKQIMDMFAGTFESFLETTRNVSTPVVVSDNWLALSACRLMESLMMDQLMQYCRPDGEPNEEDKNAPQPQSAVDRELIVAQLYYFTCVWTVGAVSNNDGRAVADAAIKNVIEKKMEYFKKNNFITMPEFYDLQSGAVLPAPPRKGTLHDYFVDPEDGGKWKLWTERIAPLDIAKGTPYHTIVVPTADTERNQFLIRTLIEKGHNILISGPTGTAKTASINGMLLGGFHPKKYSTIAFAFSAQTTANQTQDIIDGKLDKRRKGVYGPPINKKMLVFIDDLNMPIKETYGAQPPIEILRQAMVKTPFGFGWYDRKGWDFRSLVDINYLTAMGPPGGGKNDVTDRYSRMFNLVFVTPFDDESLARIFSTVVGAFFSSLARDVAAQVPAVVGGVLDVYTTVMKDFLPTPAKSHYTFNMRDVSKVFQGMCVCQRESLPKVEDLCKVWMHECERVFRDRLINRQDQNTFNFMIKRLMDKHFKKPYDQVVKLEPVIFVDFVDPKSTAYQEATDHEKLLEKVQECLDDYNNVSKIRLDLVLFTAFLEHICRVIRVLKLPLGNALLVGVGGSGRKSVTTLATYVAEFELFQIELAKGYGMNEWHDDIKRLLISAGGQMKNMVFLFPDTQIANEAFLEEVSSILNTGEVPNLYSSEDKMEIMELCAKGANAVGQITPNEVFAWYVGMCRKNLHICLALSPIGAEFRLRLRNFPSLVNCCTIDWFMEWPPQALTAVAKQFLQKIDMDENVKESVVKVMVEKQTSVIELAEKFFKQEKRIFYVTPTSYLDLISTFIGMLNRQRDVVATAKSRYDVGMEKIEEAASAVGALQKDLEDLQPSLEKSAKETSELMIHVEGEQKKANEKQKLVDADAAAAEEEGRAANEIKADCEKDLAAAMPALDAAVDALSKLSKGDIGEVKAMKTPPAGVILTSQALCYMFGVKPVKVAAPDGKGKVDDFWEPAKKELLGDPRLLERMVNYDKDNMTAETITKVQPLYDSEMFDPDIIKKASIAAMGICKWVRAMVVYDKVAKEVGPKRAKLAKAEKSAADAMELLATKKAELAEVIALVDKLVNQLNDAKNKMEELQRNSDDCRAKLIRAEKLITGLGGEKAAWTQNSAKLGKDYTNLTGDILVASGILAYLGCFTGVYRKEACDRWLAKLTELQIPASAEFTLANCIGNQVKIRKWVINALPNDGLSIDNAIILDNSRRWPLMIDPQNQANKWVKKTHGEKLKVIRLNQNYARQLETCISFGTPVLIENIGLTIDAMLNPLLLKATFKQGAQEMIRLGDSTIEYAKEFKLYFTTKLPNPHYAPEICVAACLLNFMATVDGLTDAMLGQLIALEEPEIEASRIQLVIDSAESKAELAEIENKILALLSASSGDILEDEELINTLASSKITSTRIFEQVKVQEMTAATIAETRVSYTPHSFRCAALFFIISDLRIVDPMYEFSLDWFIVQFVVSVQRAEAKEAKDDRLQELFRSFLARLYDMVCRSLFAKDKLLYSLMLCLKCQETDKELNQTQLLMLLTCLPGAATEPKPENSDWLTEVSWARVTTLTSLNDAFEGFTADFAANLEGWKAVFDSEDPMAAEVEWPKNFKQKCNPLQRALTMFALRTDATVTAIQEIVLAKLGREYLLVPPFDLPTWFLDSTPMVPLIFILSSGSDPMADVTALAIKHDMLSKIVPISLGQGQGPKATAGIKDGSANGKWVLLQNCHLGISYMPILEGMIEAWKPEDLNPAFRLWLTACPSPDFPISILQGGIKMTIEPPKGLRNSLQRAYRGMDEEWFESSSKPTTFKKLLFGLCFFHGMILERRAFGPIGWNVMYGFSEPDLDISQKQLRNFLEDFSETPYAALNYMVAEANYGGRVTDGQDRRLIVEIIKDFYTPKILEDDYKFSISGIYYSPNASTIAEHQAYIDSLPLNHTPEVFWLHPNASLTASINEGVTMLKSAMSLMSSFGGGGGDDEEEGAKAETPEQRYCGLAEQVIALCPEAFDLGAVGRKYPVKYDQCLNTVLLNELIKFIKLYNKIVDTCSNLGKAAKGLVIFSPELEEVANGFLTNAIPPPWLSVSYPSLKPAMSYVFDFVARCKFVDDWIKQGAPTVFWFSSFFFQQAFLTGVFQNFARGASIAIDKLMWNFEVMKGSFEGNENPERGAYIRGLYMQGARWDDDSMTLADSYPKVLWSTVPLLWLIPEEKEKDRHDYPKMYANPVYKCSDRKGVLSTSGHSSNFIMWMYMPCNYAMGHNENFWTKRGVAMISQTDD